MIGTVVGFDSTRLTTATSTLIRTGSGYMTARLVAGAAAITMDIYDSVIATTAAASKISTLKCAASNTVDEQGIPLRFKAGISVKLSVATGEAYIFVR